MALAVAQAPPSPKPGMGPPGGFGGPGGPGGPPGGKGKGKGDGKGGGFAKMSCAAKCLQPVKDSGCKFPFPKKGDGSGPSPGGPPPKGPSPAKSMQHNHMVVARQAPAGGPPPPSADGTRPPRPKADPEAVKQFQTCLCTNKPLMDSIQTCVPSACSGEGQDPAPIFKMYNRMCKGVDSFKPLDIPGGGAPPSGPAPPPKAPAPKAAVVMSTV